MLLGNINKQLNLKIREMYPTNGPKKKIREIPFFLICAVGLWVLRPLLAYCTSPG
jgi:hypothetical protein